MAMCAAFAEGADQIVRRASTTTTGPGVDGLELGASVAYSVGVQFLNRGDYEKALEQFRRSYSVVASPNSQLMVARALALLNRKAEAYQVAERVIEQARAEAVHAPKYEQE
mgnify:CR=1 FL=1